MARRGAALLLVLVLAGACGDDGDGGATAAEAPHLRATASRSTLFNTQRTFRLLLENEGDATVPVTSIQLDSPLFEPVDPSVRDTELAPGQGLLMPLRYGDAACDVEAPVDQTVVVDVDGDEVGVPLAQDPDGVVDDLHTTECTDAAIRARVDIGFGDEWALGRPFTARGLLEIEARRDGVATEVEAVEGNVIFGIEAPLPTMPGLGIEVGALPVTVSADRCDRHALIESKRTFIFRITVAVDGEPPFPLDIEAEGRTREVLEGLLQACANAQ